MEYMLEEREERLSGINIQKSACAREYHGKQNRRKCSSILLLN